MQMEDNVEKQMTEQDKLAQQSAKEFDLKHKDDGEPITEVKKRNSVNEFVTGYIVNPIAGWTEKIIRRFDKNATEPMTEGKNTKLLGGSATDNESKIKGFNRKHVIIIGSLLTLIVVLGVSMGTGFEKKAKKNEVDVDRGAITGQHMTTMPKDYTELAAAKRRQQAEEERKRELEAQKKEQNRNKSKEDTRPTSQKARDDRPPSREINSGNSSSRDSILEAKLAREEAYRQHRAAAMSSPIGFEVKKR